MIAYTRTGRAHRTFADQRFGVQVTKLSHPAHSRVRSLVAICPRAHYLMMPALQVRVKKVNLARPFEPRALGNSVSTTVASVAGVVDAGAGAGAGAGANESARLVGGLTREFVAATLYAVSADTFIPEILNLVIGHLTGMKHCPTGFSVPFREDLDAMPPPTGPAGGLVPLSVCSSQVGSKLPHLC